MDGDAGTRAESAPRPSHGLPSISVDAGTVLLHAGDTDEDMSNFRACSLWSIVEKRAAPARPSVTVSALETRLRPPASSCKPCDNRGNQAPRRRQASLPSLKAPVRESRQSR